MRHILITGGFGFIGSNLVRYWMEKYPEDRITVIDCMTYAAREKYVTSKISALMAIARQDNLQGPKFQHVYCDIRNAQAVRQTVRVMQPEHIIHLAAESHVCRSIDGPKDFIQTNIVGTFNLLEAFRDLWSGHPSENHRFHHVSTDEVYGELGENPNEKFHESLKYKPRSPYAASKAASDLLVQSWAETYGLNVVTTNCSNNFGPNQHEEKLIPKAILSILNGNHVTVYGQGNQIRDWLYVVDHCRAIDTVFHEAKPGEQFCVGGENELSNLSVIETVHRSIERLLHRQIDLKLVHTDDRPTDDFRYAIDCSKLKSLGWSSYPELFQENLDDTIRWYMAKAWK